MTDTRREDAESGAEAAWRASQEVNGFAEDSWAEVSEPQRESWRHVARAVLAVLPAPPVVDEGQIQDIIREAYDTHIDLGSPARRGEFVFTAAEVIAARLRGATRG